MPLSNADRQKRWLAKNRAAFNLKRRNARKNLGGGVGTGSTDHGRVQPNKAVTTSPAQKASIESLRELMETVSKEPEKPVIKPLIYRNDITGQVISECAWNDLQRRKEAAKNGGYELDAYSQ